MRPRTYLGGISKVKVALNESSLLEVPCDALILAVHPEVVSEAEGLLDSSLAGAISARRSADKLRTDRGEMTSFFPAESGGPDRITLVGTGENDLDGIGLRRLFAGAIRNLVSEGVRSVAADLTVPGFDGDTTAPITEGCFLGGYRFTGYKKDDDDPAALESLTLGFIDASSDVSSLEPAIERSRILAEATAAARDLGNEPGNVLTPSEFARRALKMSEELGLESESYDEEALEKMGMGALLGVARGSEEPAHVVKMEYDPGIEGAPTLVLIGKGLTFDSGGISIKSSQGMHEMKMDMGGAAAVFGAMMAIANLRPTQVRVIGYIGAVENMPDGRATKPGDVLTACDGTSVEVINTDAEGRLVVGDLVAHAVKTHDVDWIVDVATLTGAVMVALGNQAAGVISSDDGLFDAISRAGDRVGERYWRLPAYEEYREDLKSEIADIKNSGARYAGAITGGLFIGSFRGETPWAHLDIAGVAWTDKAGGLDPVGATGFGARTLAVLADTLSPVEAE